jgi:hypothetical protein
VQHDHVRSNHLGDRCLKLQLLNRRSYDLFALRVEYHELIGVQTQPHVVGARQCAGPLECTGDRAQWVELLQVVAGNRMGGEWKDLTVYAKGADAELMAALDGRGKRIRVVRRDFSQVGAASLDLQTTCVPMCGGAERDGRVEKLTAESPTQSGAGSWKRGAGSCEQLCR